jgi:MFS family permease
MGLAKGSIWGNRDFLKLWIGQSISQVGAQISVLALPLMAMHTLQATPFQMGILRAAEFVPFALFGLFAGVLCDRVGCRPILIVCDIARTLILMAIPLAAMMGAVPIGLLYATAFMVGVATVFFDVAYWSYLPSLVAREDLVKGNSKLSLSQSAAESLGPGAAGLLVQLLSAPFAIALNAASFLLSAVSLVMIQARPTPPAAAQADLHIFARLMLGLKFVLGHATLRSLMLRATLWNFLYNMAMPVFLLLCMQVLALSATSIGLLFTALGVGLVAGATLVDTALFKHDVAKLINASMVVAAVSACGLAIRLDNAVAQVALLSACLFVIGVANAIYNISNVSLRQKLTPPELLGQMTAAMRFVSWGTIPLGALLGGAMGERIGFLSTLLCVGAAGLLTSLVGLLRGSLNRVIVELAAEQR